VSKLDAIAVAQAIGDIPQNVNFAIKAEIAEIFLRSQGVEPRFASAAPQNSSGHGAKRSTLHIHN
jgi:serine protease Do